MGPLRQQLCGDAHGTRRPPRPHLHEEAARLTSVTTFIKLTLEGKTDAQSHTMSDFTAHQFTVNNTVGDLKYFLYKDT